MEQQPTKFDAIYALVGGAIAGSDDGEVEYMEGQTPPSKEEIDAKFKELTDDWTAKEYARNRKVEYDALNQFELISDDDANSTTTHKDAIAAIKTKWPKDNSGPK